jgi:DNA repair protein RadD
MSSIIQRWHSDAPYVRGCILAHRKELVQQNFEKLKIAYPGENIGIFSAGLGKRDYTSQILFASIDSVYKKAGEFQPFDFIFVDEAHRIPPAGEGKYRTFIKECMRFSPKLRVVGWTATPFRMGCGPICHPDHILHEICYEADIHSLIKQGYLSALRTKVGEAVPDLSGVRKSNTGDYVVKSLAEATNEGDLAYRAVQEALRIAEAENRKSFVFFCVDVEHCLLVSKYLGAFGIDAPAVTGKTKKEHRDKIVEAFKAKQLNAVCCVNVLTEGFDAPHIDCIVLLRPTLSAGLFSQMVGRGLRIEVGKRDCLVLDFAGCIEEHGPVDLLGKGQETVMAVCEVCRESFSRAIRSCPACGWEIPKREVERLEAAEAVKRMHGTKASKKSILSTQPETYTVTSVTISRHKKDGSPDSMKVQYRCGLTTFNEWICLDHPGYASEKAYAWYLKRFGKPSDPGVATVNGVLGNMFSAQTIMDYTKTITVVKKGKYKEIIDYNRGVV